MPSDIRIYVWLQRSVVASNYVRPTGETIHKRLGASTLGDDYRIVWAVVPYTIVYQDSNSHRLCEEVRGWRDLTEEDVHAFKMEESLEGGRARELQIQPLHPMGKNNGSSG